MRRGINYVCSAMMAFFAIMAPGCDNDDQELIIGGDEVVGTITFQSVGLTFSSDKYGDVHAEIPASGCSFSITPDDEFKDSAFITAVCIDGEDLVQPVDFSGEPPYLTSLPILSGEWGGFVHKIEDGRRVIEVTINENTSPGKRRIGFQIGGRQAVVYCILMQEGAR